MPDEYRFLVDGHIPVLKLHSEPRPGPAVLVLHGLGADAETQRGELRVLAEGGLSAVGVDAPHHGARRNGWLEARARLGPSEAHAWLLRAVQDWARDVSRVIDHLMHEGHGPIGLAGISFGAYTALTVATEDARVRATVSLLGSPDWSPREGPITGELQELTRHAPVHRPWECARNPLLLVNAGRDGIVPPHRARDFARRLQAEQSPGSAPVEYLEYPESDHMMRPEDWEDGWRRTLGFLQRHLGVLALLLVSLCLSSPAQAQTWSLTHEQRQAFLHHYAPIVLKRANANNDRHGYDWITNFDFDQDGDFSNNKRNWKNIPQYVNASRTGTGAYAHWRIRPTLYTSLIEFMDGGKNLVLIYHVYHALDKNAAGDYQLHDWERVELLVKNVVGPPGSGESVAHAVVTQHKRNVIRRLGDAQLNFLSTATGHHLLIWQAEWSDKLLAAHGQELRFVTQPGAWVSAQLAANAKAEVGVNNDSGKKNVHYAFVPRGSPGAVSTFGAEALTLATAERLASRAD
ncbi:MAG: prolyl oligopeptidase family serine peptidase, partial [Cystobacter sp.]